SPITDTGTVPSLGVRRMSEPVTTTSSIAGSASLPALRACASVDGAAASSRPPSARCTMKNRGLILGYSGASAEDSDGELRGSRRSEIGNNIVDSLEVLSSTAVGEFSQG